MGQSMAIIKIAAVKPSAAMFVLIEKIAAPSGLLFFVLFYWFLLVCLGAFNSPPPLSAFNS
jgi:hypothetical protein